MENNYELHLNRMIYLLYLKLFQMVDMEIIGKVNFKFSIVRVFFHKEIILVIDSMPSLPSFTQLNTIIRQSNNLTCEHLCLIRACLLKQKKLNE